MVLELIQKNVMVRKGKQERNLKKRLNLRKYVVLNVEEYLKIFLDDDDSQHVVKSAEFVHDSDDESDDEKDKAFLKEEK